MPANYVLLEKVTVGASGSALVTFSGIPQTGYTDLVIKMSTRSLRTGSAISGVSMTLNGSSASFQRREVYNESGIGFEVASTPQIGSTSTGQITNNTFGSAEIYISKYNSSAYKAISVDSVSENNDASNAMWITNLLWSEVAAITSISFATTENFAQHSTFYLYGVAALGTTPVIAPYATGGDTIMTDGTYWYHAFLSSGTFTPATALSCDVLVVAGGGGGGSDRAGGGGAGGYRSTTSLSLSTATSVTIGAGGAGGVGPSANNGTKGSNSVFSTITSTGGGFGSGGSTGGVGGSGGGAFGQTNYAGGAGNQGSFSPVEGYAGGSSFQGGAVFSSGGGGGAGGVGSAATISSRGAGGPGSNAHASWLSPTGLGVSGYIAGGGGGAGDSMSTPTTGAAGGSGGGGAGGNIATVGSNAVANTGSGGGGGGNNGAQSGGAGGSGIILVRYAV